MDKNIIVTLILLLSNLLVLCSEQERKYTQNTCHRTYSGAYFQTDEERKRFWECDMPRFETYDKKAKKYIAHIAYDPSQCSISRLRVDEEYKRQGIGRELATRAIEDMRVNYNCGEISLLSSYEAEKFWEKLGAKPRRGEHVFPDPSSK